MTELPFFVNNYNIGIIEQFLWIFCGPTKKDISFPNTGHQKEIQKCFSGAMFGGVWICIKFCH